MGTAPLMRVVLDSNILFSALISSRGAPQRIYDAWEEGTFRLITCAGQLEELRRASRYPKFEGVLRPHRVGRMINALAAHATPDPPPGEHEADDPDDAWLLALADASAADWLFTGDRRSGLLARGHLGRTRIATSRTFCAAVLDRV